MANKSTNVAIVHDLSAEDLDLGQKPDTERGLLGLVNYLVGVLCGVRHARLVVTTGTGALALSTVQAGSVNGTVVINGTSLAGNGADATARAADAVTNINASAAVLGIASAALNPADATQVIVTAAAAGAIGNAVTITVAGTGWTATGSGKLAGGATSASKTYHRGL